MLVLKKPRNKPFEKVFIDANGEPIEIYLIQIKGKQIRLGVKSNKDRVKVKRINIEEERKEHEQVCEGLLSGQI